jgi:DNA-binding MarR family transcriptional regulator
MADQRLSRLQRRILAWLDLQERRRVGQGTTHHRALVHAMGVDKGNLSRSLKGLERQGLVYVHRSEGGRAEAVNLIRARYAQLALREVVPKEDTP